jgi:hypothetical protein
MEWFKQFMGQADEKKEENELNLSEEKLEPFTRWQKELPRDLWLAISKFLTRAELANLFRTCRQLNLSREKSIWRAKCVQLWKHKIVNPKFIEMAKGRNGSPKEALQLSLIDGARTKITQEEMQSITWHVIYRPELLSMLSNLEESEAEEQKLELEPYFKFGKTRQRKLLPDGQIAATGDVPESILVVENMKHWRWQLVERYPDQYLLYSSPNQRFPTCIVSRQPNWGWAMQSSMVLWLSFDPGEKALELAEQDLE